MTNHYGSIEAGGTKFVLAIGDEQFNILKSKSNSNDLSRRNNY